MPDEVTVEEQGSTALEVAEEIAESLEQAREEGRAEGHVDAIVEAQEVAAIDRLADSVASLNMRLERLEEWQNGQTLQNQSESLTESETEQENGEEAPVLEVTESEPENVPARRNKKGRKRTIRIG